MSKSHTDISHYDTFFLVKRNSFLIRNYNILYAQTFSNVRVLL